MRSRNFKTVLAGSVCALALNGAAFAQTRTFDVPAGDLSAALDLYIRQSGEQLIYRVADVRGMRTSGVQGALNSEEALQQLLSGTELRIKRDPSGLIAIASATAPQSGSAAGAGAEVEALIVTAQKREEDIQDVPIAISAFTQEALERSQIAGGPDLITQVPNMTFTKTNFTSYSIQIRGIGTQAISATTDNAVAVAFNNSSQIRNRFFEQEFYDLQRVEVLRGPQGTLYGRNATAGVINLITARPKDYFEAKLSADVANYSSSRLEGMLNLPLAEGRAALRLAGAWTKREGYTTNQTTGAQIDGRDLWSGRATLWLDPSSNTSIYLTYERFEEDDDRLRSGKQLCKKDETPESIRGVPVPMDSAGGLYGVRSYIGQGCLPVSMYSEEAFQTPNGLTLPFYGPTSALGNLVNEHIDPYVSAEQSRDLRVIESTIEPRYQADADLAHLQINIDITDDLSVVSETVYNRDFTFSTQDYNRFTTKSGAFDANARAGSFIRPGLIDEDGTFCDPQLGCSDTLLLGDLATAESTQFSQELRLSSNYEDGFNFSIGANLLKYDTEDRYYVFINSLTLLAAQWGERDEWVPGVSDNMDCQINRRAGPTDRTYDLSHCPYIDPNPIESLNGLGHNYFLSRNPYRLKSYALFGEAYYNITPSLKVTAGLRYTVDQKRAPRVPSQLLVGKSFGYPVADVVDQEWREPTGRLAVDWKPALNFTDETLLYASYAHGYKAGGANPPTPVYTNYGAEIGDPIEDQVVATRFLNQPRTFEAEFVDAFEIGSKNTLLDGKLTLNGVVFYYDYKDYQISQIVNRSAVNLNFDAEIWGVELEADWRPMENLRLGLKLGYENTRVADGMQAIDMMDRTAGNPDYMVIKPFPTMPSNCIVPVEWVVRGGSIGIDRNTCRDLYYLGRVRGGLDPSTVPNNGEGILKDLGGNELPNAPDFTATLTVDYTIPLAHDWLMTLHADLYRQSEAWGRIFNLDPYDRIHAFEQVNLAAIFTHDDGWNVMAYVKNALDADNITGAFLNSDDTGLTTNVFLNEPRLFGLRVTKGWTGSPMDAFSGLTKGPIEVEVGGGLLRTESNDEAYLPEFSEAFADSLRPALLEGQQGDLDWGDSREVKLSYQPQGGPWVISTAARFGKTNGSAWAERVEEFDGGGWLIVEGYEFPALCGETCYIQGGVSNYARGMAEHHEDHTIIDLMVGRDVGLGLLGDSTMARVSAGLRYARLGAGALIDLEGRPNYYIPFEYIFGCGLGFTCPSVTHYSATMTSERRLEAVGPMVGAEFAAPLFDAGDYGRIELDVAASGGVLFGRQTMDMRSEVDAAYYDFRMNHNGPAEPTDGYSPLGAPNPVPSFPLDLATSRREQATVPNLQLSLGLAYRVQGLKVSAGYRWDRYFDAIDGGISERRLFDRTIDGPYFKLAVGFGG